MSARFPRTGPTPVGQRLRASTIPAQRRPGPSVDEWTAWDRDEDEPCERGTIGCCVLHGTGKDGCETW